jgi:hypothetical protein
MREARVNVLIGPVMTTPPDPSDPRAAPPRPAAERYLDLWERHLSLTARDGRIRRPQPDEGRDAPE